LTREWLWASLLGSKLSICCETQTKTLAWFKLNQETRTSEILPHSFHLCMKSHPLAKLTNRSLIFFFPHNHEHSTAQWCHQPRVSLVPSTCHKQRGLGHKLRSASFCQKHQQVR
jgi:hypothetical protein